MRSLCSIIAPRQVQMIGSREDGYLAECILKYLHDGPHVFKTPEGRFFAWEDYMECDCCGPDEDERCAVYGEIRESDIPNLSKKQT